MSPDPPWRSLLRSSPEAICVMCAKMIGICSQKRPETALLGPKSGRFCIAIGLPFAEGQTRLEP